VWKKMSLCGWMDSVGVSVVPHLCNGPHWELIFSGTAAPQLLLRPLLPGGAKEEADGGQRARSHVLQGGRRRKEGQ